jgi:hypothetical protein
MRAKTTVFIVFLAVAFVFAMVSHGFAAQTTSERQSAYPQNEQVNQQNQPGNNSNFSNDLSTSAGTPNNPQNSTNQATSPGGAPGSTPGSDIAPITPGVGNTQQPVASRGVGWGWLILGLVIGFAIGAVTMGPRRRYTTAEDIRRDRAA